MEKFLPLALLALFTFAPFVRAQEDVMLTQEEAETEAVLEEADEELEYKTAYGQVSGIDEDARTITILQFDYELEEEVGVTYVVKDDAEIEGVKTLGEIHEGDWVDIEYEADENGEKEADFVSVEIEPILGEGPEELEEIIQTETGISE